MRGQEEKVKEGGHALGARVDEIQRVDPIIPKHFRGGRNKKAKERSRGRC